MGDKEDYLTSYRVFFENFAATVNPEDQLPVNIAGYTITESELTGEVLYWITQYLTEKQCPLTLMTPLLRIILDEVQVASKKFPNEFGYKSDESVYIALRLMQAATARVNAVCLRYLDNSRLDSLPPPPPLAQRDLKTVSCATKNSRRVMEDRHVEIGNLEALFGIETTEPTSFYAVYDGHAGAAAATYCAAHLHQYLVENPHFTGDLRKAMRDAFLRTDAEFIRKSNQERACGGSTAVAVTVRGRRLVAAWAGDSLALLAKRMRLMQLVRPHKPSREDERDRIESSGGSVMYWGTWRVNGQLAVSRAIGDAQYKPYVTARPEIATVDLDGDEDFVVVACDGLWDFVSEDDVALAVYRQLAADPDDLKAVTKSLIVQAKRQGSADNISIIVVFLKDPRDIAADNRPPMDLGLDNALANAPPFASETEACKRQAETAALTAAAGADADAEAADNGVDNSDSDSEDLGPETAVDADDVDAERNHEPAPPTPPAHTVEAGHVDGALVDNVAESGDESEDEWNYFKGEGEREEHNPTEEPDEPPRSETPGQDNSAWETSSVDMNSSPLNPDAPVFIPGSVAGSDVLLAESPRKPVPMDDIELPDVAQFETEAVVRPAELLDLDNCDQLNGHHNVSIDDAVKEHLNGNDKCTMDSLGFGFNVGIETDKVKESGLIQDFERIQKDTTDFCNIQVFQTHSETNPFATEGNDELFERLKNKERDPMSMSFYQEKDDDTCERLAKNESHVDLNAVQPLPDSDDEDLQPNGICDNDKENVSPDDEHTDLFGTRNILEPNNDIMRFDERTDNLSHNIASFGQDDNCMEYMVSSSTNMSYPNIEIDSGNIPQDTVQQTDTPESHKLLFEQIPEIPDGKSSELGFTTDDNQDASESERDPGASTPQDETSQDIEMESKLEDSPSEELQPEIQTEHLENEQVSCHRFGINLEKRASPAPALVRWGDVVTPEPTDGETNVSVEVHCNDIDEIQQSLNDMLHDELERGDIALDAPEIVLEDEHVDSELALAASPLPAHSPLPGDATASPLPAHSPLPSDAAASPLPAHSPLNGDAAASPLPVHSPLPGEVAPSPLPAHSPLADDAAASPLPAHSPVPGDEVVASPLPALSPVPGDGAGASPLPSQSPLPTDATVASPLPSESPAPREASTHMSSPAPSSSPAPQEIPAPAESPAPCLPSESPLFAVSPAPREPSPPTESPLPVDIQRDSPLPTDASLPRDSPLPSESPLPREAEEPREASAPAEETFAPLESQSPSASPPPSRSPLPTEVRMPNEATIDDVAETAAVETVAPASVAGAPSPLPADVPLPGDSPAPPASPAPRAFTPQEAPADSGRVLEPAADPEPERTVDVEIERTLTTEIEAALEATEPPAMVAEEAPLAAAAPAPRVASPPATAPAPDLVPEPRADLVTDVDVGVAESRAQEICVPVTSEIQPEDGEQHASPPPAAPAVEPAASAPLLAAAAGVTATAAVAAAAATAATKSKTASVKKSPSTPASKSDARTPRSAPKPSAPTPRTPASATKRPTSSSIAPRTPGSAPRPAPARPSPASKPATPAAAKAAAPAAKPAPITRPGSTKAAAPARPAAASTVPKPAAKSPAAPTSRVAPAPRPAAAPAPRSASAPRAAAPRPAPARPAAKAAAASTLASRPTPRPAPAAARPASAVAARTKKLPEKKPLTNGDVKEVKPAPITRPAPRPAPRAAPPAPAAPAAPAAPRAAAPRPATRAPLDKQSKDLANKRITAKAAPPRTAVTKAAVGAKSAVTRVGPKKSIEKAAATNGLSNGEGDKAPPSPPAADAALLPDVIA